jgi:hypothetical protein
VFRSAYLVAQQLSEHPITEAAVFALAAIQLRLLAGACPRRSRGVLEDLAEVFERASDRFGESEALPEGSRSAARRAERRPPTV